MKPEKVHELTQPVGETQVMPPHTTAEEAEQLFMRDALAVIVREAMVGDPRLTSLRVKAILGSAAAHIRNKTLGQSSHRIIIDA